MTRLQPAIKWTGSKRGQASRIVECFPKRIDTYYEPFLGGASVLFRLLHSEIEVGQFVGSDINADCISLWNLIKSDYQALVMGYSELWKMLNASDDIEQRKKFFYDVRTRFNLTKNPIDFFFLSRTCTNGLIRYNSKGEFNTSLHFSRPGIEPEKAARILKQWSVAINSRNVQFVQQDYRNVKPQGGDYVYLDPPYFNTKGIYYGVIDYNEFWAYLRSLPCAYSFSFDGTRGDVNNTFSVPADCFTNHRYIDGGRSSFKDLRTQITEYVKESFYERTLGADKGISAVYGARGFKGFLLP